MQKHALKRATTPEGGKKETFDLGTGFCAAGVDGGGEAGRGDDWDGKAKRSAN